MFYLFLLNVKMLKFTQKIHKRMFCCKIHPISVAIKNTSKHHINININGDITQLSSDATVKFDIDMPCVIEIGDFPKAFDPIDRDVQKNLKFSYKIHLF